MNEVEEGDGLRMEGKMPKVGMQVRSRFRLRWVGNGSSHVGLNLHSKLVVIFSVFIEWRKRTHYLNKKKMK